MVLTIKQLICHHMRHHLTTDFKFNYKSIKTTKIVSNESNDHKFYIDINGTDINHNSNHEFSQIITNLLSKLSFITRIRLETNPSPDDSTHGSDHKILLDIDDRFYVTQLIHDLKGDKLSQTYGPNTLNNSSDSSGYGCPPHDGSQPVVVEFSSPNIAKPFHVGNYRSTIIGNFVANFHRFCGHRVVGLNYLGDFGTQFGILSLAYDRFGDDHQLAANPLRHLFDVYVRGNQECEASEEWRQSAKDRFRALETKQNTDVLNQWLRFRELSVDRLKSLYRRLGVEFDEFHSESMYSEAGHEVVDELRQLGLIESAGDDSGAQYAVVGGHSSTNGANTVGLKIPVIKSDGSTLYLTRDIAAAIHRKQLFSFNKMFYIVDSSQAKHFNNLFQILPKLNHEFEGKLIHLRFGRILGMSTRKGDIVFLEDVLNEAKERAIESCKTSPNTKISEENFDSVADILGISGLLVHDMSYRRVQDYRFNWDKALRHTGDTGIALQYTHARLCSLETNCGVDIDLDFEPNVDALSDFEAKLLMNRLSQFDEILIASYESLDPSLLVHYLFDLRNALNRANQALRVKGQESDVAKTRLLLFRCGRNVLNQGMRLLGLKPLMSM